MGFDINDMLDSIGNTNAGSEARDKMKDINSSLKNIAETLKTGKAPVKADAEYQNDEPVILPPPEIRDMLPSDFQFFTEEEVVFRCQHKGGNSCFIITPSNIFKAIGAALFGIVAMIFAHSLSLSGSFVWPLIFMLIGLAGAYYNLYDPNIAKENKKVRNLIITNKRIIDSDGDIVSAFTLNDITDVRAISDSQLGYTCKNCLDENGKPLCIKIFKLKNAGEICGIIMKQINRQNDQ